MNTIQTLNTERLQKALPDANYCCIDVRNPDEHKAGSVANVCWPVNDISASTVGAFVREQNITPDQTLVLVCASGRRAQMAAEKLRPLLPNPIAVVEGGQAKPVVGKPRMSLERQVRIAAGLLVTIGALAALLVHPLAVLLCLFVGCGLIFAGATDWCGMGLLLMKMPWNRA